MNVLNPQAKKLLQSVSIKGLRGFASAQTLVFAIPTGMPGSGLTVVVGPNNAGKSTILEAARAFAGKAGTSVDFTEGKRNSEAGNRVEIEFVSTTNRRRLLRTIAAGGSETEWVGEEFESNIFAIPSRRHFNPQFGKSAWDRNQYSVSLNTNSSRSASLDNFGYRLFHIQKNPENRALFDAELGKVIQPVPQWTIEKADTGQHYLKFSSRGLTHSSEGLGEGFVSLLSIVDALYDSTDGDAIFVDEPELSLHPAFQRRLSKLLTEYSKTRQIVLATHSPYFLDFAALTNGARVARVHFGENGSTISQLSTETGSELTKLLNDTHNPHVLGLDAREGFFLDDGIFLTEGQDDVVHYQRIAEQLNIQVYGSFFGWGVGGADKMRLFAKTFSELGFAHVVGIVDNDRAKLATELRASFTGYRFEVIPARDVRTKAARAATPSVDGLLDERQRLRPQFESAMRELFARAEQYVAAKVPEQPAQ